MKVSQRSTMLGCARICGMVMCSDDESVLQIKWNFLVGLCDVATDVHAVISS